jgi:hypothetical protein
MHNSFATLERSILDRRTVWWDTFYRVVWATPPVKGLTALLSIVRENELQLLQLRILRFRLLQDWNIRVGVFPESEEIFIGRVGIGGVALHGVA